MEQFIRDKYERCRVSQVSSANTLSALTLTLTSSTSARRLTRRCQAPQPRRLLLWPPRYKPSQPRLVTTMLGPTYHQRLDKTDPMQYRQQRQPTLPTLLTLTAQAQRQPQLVVVRVLPAAAEIF
jgi:hypothetical protein